MSSIRKVCVAAVLATVACSNVDALLLKRSCVPIGYGDADGIRQQQRQNVAPGGDSSALGGGVRATDSDPVDAGDQARGSLGTVNEPNFVVTDRGSVQGFKSWGKATRKGNLKLSCIDGSFMLRDEHGAELWKPEEKNMANFNAISDKKDKVAKICHTNIQRKVVWTGTNAKQCRYLEFETNQLRSQFVRAFNSADSLSDSDISQEPLTASRLSQATGETAGINTPRIPGDHGDDDDVGSSASNPQAHSVHSAGSNSTSSTDSDVTALQAAQLDCLQGAEHLAQEARDINAHGRAQQRKLDNNYALKLAELDEQRASAARQKAAHKEAAHNEAHLLQHKLHAVNMRKEAHEKFQEAATARSVAFRALIDEQAEKMSKAQLALEDELQAEIAADEQELVKIEEELATASNEKRDALMTRLDKLLAAHE